MVVVSILAILAAMLMPAVETARQKARQAACAQNLQQIFTGWSLYAQDNEGNLGAMSIWSCAIKPRILAEGAVCDLCGSGCDKTCFSEMNETDKFFGTAPWFIALAGEGYVGRNAFSCGACPYNTNLKHDGTLMAHAMNHYWEDQIKAMFGGSDFVASSTYSDFYKFVPNGYMSNYYCGWTTTTDPCWTCTKRSNVGWIMNHNNASQFWIAVDGRKRGSTKDYTRYWYSTIGYGSWWADLDYMGIHLDGRNFLFLDGSVRYDDPLPASVNTYAELEVEMRDNRDIREIPEGEGATPYDGKTNCCGRIGDYKTDW